MDARAHARTPGRSLARTHTCDRLLRHHSCHLLGDEAVLSFLVALRVVLRFLGALLLAHPPPFVPLLLTLRSLRALLRGVAGQHLFVYVFVRASCA